MTDNFRKILVVESNQKTASEIAKILEANHYHVNITYNSTQFFKSLNDYNPDIVIINMLLQKSEKNGMDIYRSVIEDPHLKAKIILFSNDHNTSWINEVHRIGNYRIFCQGGRFNYNQLLSQVNNASTMKKHEEENLRLQVENMHLKKSLLQAHPFIGESEAINLVRERIFKLAKADEDVFLIGETGTGKEVAVHYYYLNSPRFGKEFQTVNCSALTPTLIESELFGHVKGAFTSAEKNKLGLFEICHDGLLFLDEVTNLSLAAQAKILRAIENHEIQIVGGESKVVDTKLLFASNATMEHLLQKNVLRKDLFYRIEGNIVEIAPLRERDNDIILLMSYFLTHFSQTYLNLDLNRILELKDLLLSYPWPGNVRELKNFCKTILLNEKQVTISAIKKNMEQKIRQHGNISENKLLHLLHVDNIREGVTGFEKEYLKHHLAKNNWNVNNTAKRIGLERTTLYKKVKNYQISRSDKYEV